MSASTKPTPVQEMRTRLTRLVASLNEGKISEDLKLTWQIVRRLEEAKVHKILDKNYREEIMQFQRAMRDIDYVENVSVSFDKVFLLLFFYLFPETITIEEALPAFMK